MSGPSFLSLAVFYRVFARNASLLIASRAITFLVNLLLIPYIIRRVGVEGYGILSAVAVLAALIGIVDLGLGSTSVKFLAEQIERRDSQAVNRTFWSALLPLVGLSAILSAAAVAIAGPGLWLFRIPESRLSEAFVVYAIVVGSKLLSNLAGIFWSLIWALHRVDVVGWLNLVMIPLYLGGTVWALESGWGLAGVAFAEVLTMSVIPALCIVWIVRAIYPPLRLHPRFFDRSEAISLLSFGTRIQVSNLINTFHGQVGSFVAGRVLGLRPLAFYDLAARLAAPLGMFPAFVAPFFVPIFSQLGSREGSRTGVRGLYRNGTKLLAVVLLPVATFGSLFAGPVIAIWMGPGYGMAAFGFACFLWLHLFDGVSQVGRAVSRGIGKPGLETSFELSRVVVSVVMAGVGVWVGGFSGLVLGLTVSSSAAGLIFLWRVCYLVEARGWDFAREVFVAPLLAAGVSAIFGSGLFWVTGAMTSFPWRLGALSQLVLTGGVFMLTYMGGIIWLGHLTPRDLWAIYQKGAQAEVHSKAPLEP
jgi:O-antigen/teichoic acid export membrane protein